MHRAQSILLAVVLSVAVFSPSVSAERDRSIDAASAKQQKGVRVGLVLEFKGQWVLENGRVRRPIKARGLTVFEGERPIRTSKDGSLTVSCMNNTFAVCPGNHKIGEPFLLSEGEQVDDWWTQLVPFISNYGSWIYPAARNLPGDFSLNDDVLYDDVDGRGLNVSSVVSNLPDGEYKAELVEFSEDKKSGKNSVKIDISKTSGIAVAKKSAPPGATLRSGIYTFKILSGPSTLNVDWPSSDSALIEVTDSTRYAAHKTALQVAMAKTRDWVKQNQANERTEMIRALLIALSKAPDSALQEATKARRH